jgi:hypothetical protein
MTSGGDRVGQLIRVGNPGSNAFFDDVRNILLSATSFVGTTLITADIDYGIGESLK